MAHPDLESEQRHLDHAYRCLAAMRDRTEATVAIDDMAAQAVDGEIARWHLQQRLRALDVDVPGLAFGRIDEEGTPRVPGPTWYVGRRHVEDDQGEPVVVDWRARVSTPFYRATAADAFGLTRRRRFLMTERTVDDLFDEVFDDPDSIHAARHGGIPDPLLAELERERTGEMRDIVATIQAEQDVVIRAPLESCLVVQGGPGTGKTAVGLHRAAFLLYEERRLLDEEGVLVIGPNPVFLRYISQVLPSLGETAVRQSTVERLLGGRVRAFDSPSVAALKGDERMAAVIARAAATAIKPPSDDIQVSTSWGRIRLPAADVGAAIDEIRGRGVPHNVGRNALRTQLVRMAEQSIADRRSEETAPLGFADDLRASKDFQSALTSWPAVSAPALVRRLLSSRAALQAAADGVLDEREQTSLLRKAAKRIDDEQWTGADLVLVDEAEAVADGVRRTYGHVVVDEAQDLTAMELRALARRCPRRSMTVLGDLAQATRPGAQRSWDEVLEHLGSPVGAEFTELDLGYRVPAPIIDFANRLLPEAAPDVRPSRSVREAGSPPAILEAPNELGALVQEVVDELAARWTSVGVIVPADAGVVLESTPAGVTVVPPADAKGLEFDAVVVVEPAKFVPATGDEHRAGLRLLYVALTRAVQTLTIVHKEPLPEALTRELGCRTVVGPEHVSLDGKVALVTGAAQGIGEAIALTFARFGASIAMCDRNADGLAFVSKQIDELGQRVVTGVLDVRDADQVDAFVDDAVRALGHRIDVLVNNAGGGFPANFLDVNAKGQETLIRENFTSVTNFIRACAPHLSRPASIINITSIEAHRAGPGYAVYSAMKAGVASLTQSLALELGERLVRVNCIAPDVIPTPALADMGDVATRMALPIAGHVDDVAGAALFLATDLSRFVTGTTIHVDGGNHAAGGWRRQDDGTWHP